jgi:hypothetical protein
VPPLHGMLDYTGPDHIHVDVKLATAKADA